MIYEIYITNMISMPLYSNNEIFIFRDKYRLWHFGENHIIINELKSEPEKNIKLTKLLEWHE